MNDGAIKWGFILVHQEYACAGGEHVAITVQKDGGAIRTFLYTATDLLDQLTDEQLETAALVVLRMHCQGMTRLQARNELQAGFTVTI